MTRRATARRGQLSWETQRHEFRPSFFCRLELLLCEENGLGLGAGWSKHPSRPWCSPRPLLSGYLGGDARAPSLLDGRDGAGAQRAFWGAWLPAGRYALPVALSHHLLSR